MLLEADCKRDVCQTSGNVIVFRSTRFVDTGQKVRLIWEKVGIQPAGDLSNQLEPS